LTDISVKDAFYPETADQLSTHAWESGFRSSRWFTRGWTFQELLAPAFVEFFSVEGVRLGDKNSLERCIDKITGIPRRALQGYDISRFSIEERFRWSTERSTKRKEDKTYCLLEIFNDFIIHLYGEGEHNAFDRLRAEIDERPA
jgi:hypothetical protein